jgi:hypothetical protein
MTVPIGSNTYQDGSQYSCITPLSTLYPTQSVDVEIAIFHQGTIANWTITPVWTNSP